jgi:NADP-dependent 3-hydroxy acid dehydrogenase YdfG
MKMVDLGGREALVVTGANAGIGQPIAMALAGADDPSLKR